MMTRRVGLIGKERFGIDFVGSILYGTLPGMLRRFQSTYHMREVRELQTALGLVAAGAGVSLVPDAVQRLRRDDIVYRSLDDQTVTSPIIMCSRVDDHSPEITAFLQLVRDSYQQSERVTISPEVNGGEKLAS